MLRLVEDDFDDQPPADATEPEIEAWVNRYIDAAVRLADQEIEHAQ